MKLSHHRYDPVSISVGRSGIRTAITAILASIALMSVSPVFATDAGERADHYEAAIPATAEVAAKSARKSMDAVDEALAAEDFEKIHEITYELEAAAKRLAKSLGENDEDGEALVYRIEIVHLASELGDDSVLKPAVPGLRASLNTVLAQLKL